MPIAFQVDGKKLLKHPLFLSYLFLPQFLTDICCQPGQEKKQNQCLAINGGALWQDRQPLSSVVLMGKKMVENRGFPESPAKAKPVGREHRLVHCRSRHALLVEKEKMHLEQILTMKFNLANSFNQLSINSLLEICQFKAIPSENKYYQKSEGTMINFCMTPKSDSSELMSPCVIK